MTSNEKRLIDATIKYWKHRDRISALKNKIQYCEEVDYAGRFCRDQMKEHLCDGCKESLPIFREIAELKKSTGGYASLVAKLARLVTKERKKNT